MHGHTEMIDKDNVARINANPDRICRLLPLAAAVALCFSATATATTITVNTGNLTHGFNNCTLLDAVNSINQGSLVAGTGCSEAGTFGVEDTIVLKNYVFSFSDQARAATLVARPQSRCRSRLR